MLARDVRVSSNDDSPEVVVEVVAVLYLRSSILFAISESILYRVNLALYGLFSCASAYVAVGRVDLLVRIFWARLDMISAFSRSCLDVKLMGDCPSMPNDILLSLLFRPFIRPLMVP